MTTASWSSLRRRDVLEKGEILFAWLLFFLSYTVERNRRKSISHEKILNRRIKSFLRKLGFVQNSFLFPSSTSNQVDLNTGSDEGTYQPFPIPRSEFHNDTIETFRRWLVNASQTGSWKSLFSSSRNHHRPSASFNSLGMLMSTSGRWWFRITFPFQ